MADCSTNQCDDWIQQHQNLDNGVMGKLRGLTLAQKQKLTAKIDIWIANLTQPNP